MTLAKLYLLIMGCGLSIIGLGYGVAPSWFLPMVLDIAVAGTDQTHIFRAVMCLYFAISLYWLLAAFKPDWTRHAILSCAFFVGGLGVGRLVSLLVDGLPSALLIFYLLLEAATAAIGVWLFRASAPSGKTASP